MSRIPINEIVGVSVLDIVRQAGGRIDKVKLGNGTPLIEAAMVQDVFYMPSALAAGQSLQLVGNRHMPMEAVFDDFTRIPKRRWMAQYAFWATSSRVTFVIGMKK